jgi:hypothetical protein
MRQNQVSNKRTSFTLMIQLSVDCDRQALECFQKKKKANKKRVMTRTAG